MLIMNSLLSKLARGLSPSSPHQRLLPSTNICGQILLSAHTNPMPLHRRFFHCVPKCAKRQNKSKMYYKAVHFRPTCLPQICCFHQSLVYRTRSNDHKGQVDNKSHKTISWKFHLCNSYGMLSIKTDKSVKISRIDVLQHPRGDFAAFHLLGRDDKVRPDRAELSVDYDERTNRLSLVDINKKQPPGYERWVLEVPPYYDLTLEHTGVRSVGDIHVHNLKSRAVILDSTDGEVRSTKVLQGNAVVKTAKNKGFTADRLQGEKFDIQTEDGNVRCKDIYGNTSKFLSKRGKIHLGNMTGDCSVVTQGDVDIGSMDGSLKAKVSRDGSLQAYLVRPAAVSINTEKGDVSVSLPSDVKCHLSLTARNINIPAEMNLQMEETEDYKKMTGSLNEVLSPPVSVSSKEGSISLSMQSWFDSLKLGRS